MSAIPFPSAALPILDLSAIANSARALTRLIQEGETVPGATDGILLMGIIIVLIIVIPIVWARRRWMR